MKFFGVHIEDLESEKFLSASNDQIAAWLFLHALCSKQMNGGTIPSASTLPERFWSRHGVSVDIIIKSSPLWVWNGDDLTVEPYDIDGENLVARKVKGGKDGAAKRWKGTENRSPNRSPNRPYPTQPNPTQPDPTLPKKKTSSGDEGESLFENGLENPPMDDPAETIYKEYPRKVAKKEGLEAIRKALKKNTAAFLIEKTKLFAVAVKGMEKKFIPHPATWFNKERFSDDPEEWKETSANDKSLARVEANTPTMDRIGGWFDRPPGYLWTIAESEALERLSPPENEIGGMELLYLSNDPDFPKRQSLIAMLNNWQSELDKARLYCNKQG